MKDIIKEMYEPCLLKMGFYRINDNKQFNQEGTCYTISPKRGKGNYWVYACDNLFAISILDLVFYEDLFLEYPQSQYLSISYYDSVAGEELNPYKCLSHSCTKVHIGYNNLYQISCHRNIPICCTNISIMPEYYEDYLHARYLGEYEDLRNAFISIDGSTDFPELVFLLKQIKNCRSTGISAKLYYEGKVAEAISLIIQKAKTQLAYTVKKISQQDLDSLEVVIAYIDEHLAFNIQLAVLARLACMGTTKLKYIFKKIFKSTIFEYILKKRMDHAEHLLMSTDLNINQISQNVGYKKASSFSDAFRKKTGLLPNEYRKAVMPK
ncbi:Regulatory protein PchR [Sporomusa ovata DSM 2662]|uniref:Transcriptional regulator, AraC family n=1 Tax=Sporomusa ovata TaxID=2378 RepID=A0A0U1L2Z1_9FIRM|nr:helix-turn-helix domain-containing protein [Sporomusa ovata]EQB25319.1 DNA-binding domain-containing protein, AraC-type [Sporomusa ovata DSM 2662]CQR73885.1 Transcriptional regulator, AraC family [Sporomusa ovata]